MKVDADCIINADEILTCNPSSLRRGGGMSDVALLRNGAIVVNDGLIEKIAPRDLVWDCYKSDNVIEAQAVLPPLVDSHTHLVFAGSRIDEYILKARGASYLDILSSGGGILNTVKATKVASDDELIELALSRLDRILSHGTLLIEAKSGYGLTLEDEIRILRLHKKIASLHDVEIVSTFMGAHAFPSEFKNKRREYVDLICNEMIPAVAQEKLAEFTDVFCEEGAFTLDETRRIFETSLCHGLGIRVHSEQFNSLGGSVMAAEMGALSADHLLMLTAEDIDKLAYHNMLCTFLPSSEFFMNIRDYGNARLAIDKGVPVGLATDFNAGSCLSESMPFAMSIAVLQMQLLPEEAIIAATVNPACSLNREESFGSLAEGRKANILFLSSGYREWLYHVGVNMVQGVMKSGKIVKINNKL